MPPDNTDLQIAVQEPEAWSRRLQITVPRARVQRVRSAVAGQIAQRARLPGFRAGKLPPRVVEQRFGPAIEQETLDRLIQEAYKEALEAQGLHPITQGAVENIRYERETDLEFEVQFEVRPEVELARVGGFTVTRPDLSVGEAETDSVLERLRDERAEWNPLPEGAKPDYGDRVLVEITAQETPGEPKEGEGPRAYRFELGEGQAIPSVEEAIMTLAPGEEGDFTVRFPEDFPDPEQAGQEQHLHVLLKEATRKQLPALDDDLARAVGPFDDLPALRDRVLEDLQEDAKRRAEAEVRDQLLQQILEANAFEVPASMSERYLEHMLGRGEREPATPEEEQRLAQMREALRPQAEVALKRMMVIERLAEREGLRATPDDVDVRVEELAARHERTPSEVWLQLEKSGQLQALENEITEDKVWEYLLAQNTVQGS